MITIQLNSLDTSIFTLTNLPNHWNAVALLETFLLFTMFTEVDKQTQALCSSHLVI